MEFNEKLQVLRKQKGLTQEELAASLYVSRTAISKWESGRGYPSIDSLKQLSCYFSVTLDELLSCDEVLIVAREDTRQREKRFCDLVFGLLDISVAMLLFLPFFGQGAGETVVAVSLLSLFEISPWLRIAYFALVIASALWGIFTLAMQSCSAPIWRSCSAKISLAASVIGALLFIVSQQPYAAILLFAFLIIKALMLIKWK